MARLYLRKVSVLILPPVGDGKLVENLRIKFECEKNNESNPNRCKLEIYNMAQTTKGLLEQKNTKVIVSVGYQDTAEVVFVGDVTKVAHKKKKDDPSLKNQLKEKQEGPDIISTVDLGDGDKSFRTARIEEAFPPGASYNQVFEKLISLSGVPRGSVIGVPNGQYANGLSLSGMVRDHLTDLTKKNDLEWSIQNETLQIIPKNSFTLDSIVLISPSSGLIGSPDKTAKGVQFSSLLQPKLKPGVRVQIQSKYVNGIFKVRKVIHAGDSHQGDFLSKCEATIS